MNYQCDKQTDGRTELRQQ